MDASINLCVHIQICSFVHICVCFLEEHIIKNENINVSFYWQSGIEVTSRRACQCFPEIEQSLSNRDSTILSLLSIIIYFTP